MNDLDKETNESHDKETDSSSTRYPRKFFVIRFRALLDQVRRVFVEFAQRLNDHSIHVRHFLLGKRQNRQREICGSALLAYAL